jgi:hypothetical protein
MRPEDEIRTVSRGTNAYSIIPYPSWWQPEVNSVLVLMQPRGVAASYRIFSLKRNPKYNIICKFGDIDITRKRSCFFYFICHKNLQRCPPFFQRHADTSAVPKICYHSVYCCLTLSLLVIVFTAKYCTNSGRLIRCEVILENKHALFSWIRHVRICAGAWAAA